VDLRNFHKLAFSHRIEREKDQNELGGEKGTRNFLFLDLPWKQVFFIKPGLEALHGRSVRLNKSTGTAIECDSACE